MKKIRPRHLLFVVLMGTMALGALPTLGIVDKASCTWDASTAAKHDDGVALPPQKALGFSVKTGDPLLTKDMSAALQNRLHARGFDNLVDNPVARPRIDVALEEAQLRWTPFYATVTARARVVLSKERGDKGGKDASVTVTGTCSGLVQREPWMAHTVELLAEKLDLALQSTTALPR